MEGTCHRLKLLGAIAVILFAITGANLRASPVSQTLGKGVDTKTGEEKPVRVTGTQCDDPIGLKEIHVRLVRSSAELAREMEIGFASKMTGETWDVEAKTRFVHSESFSSSSLYLLVRSKVVCYKKSFCTAELNQEEAQYLDNGDTVTFRNHCGDRFVSGETYGRELYGVLQIDNYTNQTYDKVSAQLKGRYYSFTASADFSQAIRNISKQETIQCELHAFG